MTDDLLFINKKHFFISEFANVAASGSWTCPFFKKVPFFHNKVLFLAFLANIECCATFAEYAFTEKTVKSEGKREKSRACSRPLLCLNMEYYPVFENSSFLFFLKKVPFLTNIECCPRCPKWRKQIKLMIDETDKTKKIEKTDIYSRFPIDYY